MKYFYSYLNAEMPGKEDVARMTPNPATRQMLDHMAGEGLETSFDRFEAQQPQCPFGMKGVCCQRCLWGPCRLDTGDSGKRQRGICGADANLIIMGNLLRGMAAGCAAHGQHAREVIETLRLAAAGEVNFPLIGEERVWEMARRFGLDTEGASLLKVAGQVADILWDDLTRGDPVEMKTLLAFAPAERIETWRKLGIVPRSAYHEIVEALHRTTLGGNSDWEDLALHEVRTGLAYCWSTLFGSSLATEMLFGVPKPSTARVNYGILKEGYVNILIHGHSPTLVEKVVEKVNSPQIREMADSVGAQGIQLGGMCCTGLELLSRYGVPTVGNILGQELVVGTGAVDALVVDMQCVLPGLKAIADCFGTEIITTSDSNRIPGATHIPFDPYRADEIALKVAETAVAAFQNRDHSRMRVPDSTSKAMAGFSLEAIQESFGGRASLLASLREGAIRGIAVVAGCNNPKVPYENGHVTVASRLVEHNVLVLTTGCSAHALLNHGLCAPEAAELAGAGLRKVCIEAGIPPVLPVGACVDNTRAIRLFIELAEEAGEPLHRMPFMFSGPEPGNEKTLGQAITFLSLGVSTHQGFPGPVPVPMTRRKAGAKFPDDYERDATDVADFFLDGVESLLGSHVYSEARPDRAANLIQMHMRRKRLALGWK